MLLLFLFVACPKQIVINAERTCNLTLKVDSVCEGYVRSKYVITDESNQQQTAILMPGDEVTIRIVPGRFEMKRISFAAPDQIFSNGFKFEKATSSNFCDEKFTNQLICD